MTEVKPEVIVVNDNDSDDDRPECKLTNPKKKLLRKKKHKVDDNSDDDRLKCKPTNTKKKLLRKKKDKVDNSDYDRLECNPTNTKKKLLRKKKRKVERTLDTSGSRETLIITQKVRKQKFKCIINLTNIIENREKQKRKLKSRSTKIKKTKVEKIIPNETEVAKVKKIIPNAKKVSKVEKIISNEKEVAKHEKIVPECLRKRCKIYGNRNYDNYLSERQKKEIRRKMIDKSGKEKTEKKKFNYSCEISENESNMSSIHKTRVEPTERRSHSDTRCLSPISSGSLSDVSSKFNDDIMSYEDISSDSTIEIERLIKRTKDRERNTSLNRADDYKCSPALPRTSPRYNSISSSKILDETKDHTFSYKTYDSLAQLDIYKSRNKTCAVKPIYDCITDITNVSLPKTDEPRHVNEDIIEYEPTFTSTPKYEDNTEIVDSSASDSELSCEMDVSFHSQGTFVLEPFYSPSHSTPTDSPSLICDVYSPTVSPEFIYHEGITENTPSHCNSSPMSSIATNLIPKSATELSSLMQHKPYSPCDSPIIPIQMKINFKNSSDLDTLESIVRREERWKSKEVKVEHTSPKIDIGCTTTNFEIKNVKVEAAAVPEKLNNMDIVESIDIGCTTTNFEIKNVKVEAADVPEKPNNMDIEAADVPEKLNNMDIEATDVPEKLNNMDIAESIDIGCTTTNFEIKNVKVEVAAVPEKLNNMDIAESIDIGCTTTNFEIKNVKVEAAAVPEKLNNMDIAESIDIGCTTTNFEIKNVKVEVADVPEKLNNIDIAESSKSYVTIKEEIDEDSINNNIALKQCIMLNSSVRICNNFEDNNVGIKKEE